MDGGYGLAAFGFWMFIAAVVVAGIWSDIRKKETQQETLRRIVESGRELNPEVIDRLLEEGSSETMERDLKIGGLITMSVAPGLAMLGMFLGGADGTARKALLGVALLVGFIGAGLYAAAKLVERNYPSQPK